MSKIIQKNIFNQDEVIENKKKSKPPELIWDDKACKHVEITDYLLKNNPVRRIIYFHDVGNKENKYGRTVRNIKREFAIELSNGRIITRISKGVFDRFNLQIESIPKRI